jgi:hypothetical protein
MNISRRTLPLALLTATGLAACGSPDNSPEARARQLEEYAQSKGVDADVSINADGTPSVVVNQSLGGGTAQVGNNVALPDDFPKDVAVYPGLQIVSVARMPVGQMVQGQTADDREQVAAFYGKAMAEQGWTDATPAGAQSPAMQILQFTKDGRAATVNLLQAGATTSVQIALMPAG